MENLSLVGIGLHMLILLKSALVRGCVMSYLRWDKQQSKIQTKQQYGPQMSDLLLLLLAKGLDIWSGYVNDPQPSLARKVCYEKATLHFLMTYLDKCFIISHMMCFIFCHRNKTILYWILLIFNILLFWIIIFFS